MIAEQVVPLANFHIMSEDFEIEKAGSMVIDGSAL